MKIIFCQSGLCFTKGCKDCIADNSLSDYIDILASVIGEKNEKLSKNIDTMSF